MRLGSVVCGEWLLINNKKKYPNGYSVNSDLLYMMGLNYKLVVLIYTGLIWITQSEGKQFFSKKNDWLLERRLRCEKKSPNRYGDWRVADFLMVLRKVLSDTSLINIFFYGVGCPHRRLSWGRTLNKSIVEFFETFEKSFLNGIDPTTLIIEQTGG